MRRFLFQQAGIEQAQGILEVGCGTGAVLATLPVDSNQHILALDIDYAQLNEARRHSARPSFFQADALSLPLSNASIDIVYCHFLFLWLSNPAAALHEMARITRPGGWLLALAEPDYGGRIDFPPELAAAGRMQTDALRDQGADPLIGRTLFSMFNHLGLEEVTAGVMGGQWRRNPSPDEIHLEWETLRADLGDRLAPAEFDRLYHIETQAAAAGDRLLFVPTFYAAGRKPR